MSLPPDPTPAGYIPPPSTDTTGAAGASDQVTAAVQAAIAAMQIPSLVYAVVTAISAGPPPTLTVTLQGAATTTANVPFVSTYSPVVGDTVFCFSVAGDLFVAGAISTAQSAGSGVLPGDIEQTFNPAVSRLGWLPCTGGTYSTSTYARLFAAIGYTYGGSGTSFKVPNTSGVFLIGSGGSYSLGATGGAASVTLSVANLPSHNHTGSTASSTATSTQGSHNHTSPDGSPIVTSEVGGGNYSGGSFNLGSFTFTSSVSPSISTSVTTTLTIASQGSGTSFSVLPPYMAVNTWIKT